MKLRPRTVWSLTTGFYLLCLVSSDSFGPHHLNVVGVAPASGSDADFAEFLLERELVLRGRVQDLDTLNRSYVGTPCSAGGLGPYRTIDLTLSVDDVLVGVADDSLLVVSSVGWPDFPTDVLANGSSVLAWAYRECRDSWRLWGGWVVVRSDGLIIGRSDSPQPTLASGQAANLSYGSLAAALATHVGRSSFSAFDGAEGAWIATVTGVSAEPESRTAAISVDPLERAMGETGSCPSELLVPDRASCSRVVPGDTLLLPTTSASQLVLDRCPTAFVVHSGFCRGLGVPLQFVSYALKDESGLLRLRKVVGRD